MASDSKPQSSVATGIKVALVVIALAGAGYLAWSSRSGEAQEDTPDSAVPYMCIDCKTPFSLTPAGYERLSQSGGIKTVSTEESRRGELRFRCPKCEKFGGVPALVCPNDKTTFANVPSKGEPIKCPKCGWQP